MLTCDLFQKGKVVWMNLLTSTSIMAAWSGRMSDDIGEHGSSNAVGYEVSADK
jgi:hypothetical protein